MCVVTPWHASLERCARYLVPFDDSNAAQKSYRTSGAKKAALLANKGWSETAILDIVKS
jgi:hypothetical protein